MRITLLLLLATAAFAADDKSAVLAKMDANATHYGDVSRKIWEFAEEWAIRKTKARPC